MINRDSLPSIRNKIVAGVASYEKRLNVFEDMVDSILPQVDVLIVFLNNYQCVPEYLKRPKIKVYRSQDYENLSANGKVFYLDKIHSCYFFSLDDDIKYPPDYVEKMQHSLKKYENKVAISVHGSILPEKVEWYYERYAVYSFESELESDVFVSLIGSGTFAFHTDTLNASFMDFYPDVMVDLKFSILAKQQKVPLVCIARPEKWLQALVPDDGLFQENLERITIHTEECIKHNPWAYQHFYPIIKPIIEEVFPTLNDNTVVQLQLDENFIHSLSTQIPPKNWSETEFYKKKVRHRKVVMHPIATLVEKNKEIDDLRASVAFQIGTALVNAVKKPGKNTLLFPYYLTRILFGKKSSS